jgi:hypothetical protein
MWQWGRGKVQRRGRSDNRQARPSKFYFSLARFFKNSTKKSDFFGQIPPFKKQSSTKLDVVEIGRSLHPLTPTGGG